MRLLPVLLLVLLTSLPLAPLSAEEEARVPYAGELPGTVGEDFMVCQVLDAATGSPLAGVVVKQYSESSLAPEFWAPLVAETVTDGNGLASLGVRGAFHDCHWVFDAPGYAVRQEYGTRPPERVWLDPAAVIDGQIFGPFGLPVAGAEIELFLGCGHSPGVRRTRTGAEGAFRFEGVEPGEGQLWFEIPGAMSEYFPARGGPLHALPGVTIRGRVVDPDGVPAGGVLVTSTQCERGPATVTGPDGSFRLDGVEPDAYIEFRREEAEGEYEIFLSRSADELWPAGRPNIPLRVIVPPPGVDFEEAEEEREARLDLPVELVHLPPDVYPEDLGVGVTNLSTGLSYFAEEEWGDEEPTGRLVLSLPRGEYAVLPGFPFAPLRIRSPGPVLVSPARKGPLRLELAPAPRLSIEAISLPPDTEDAVLLVAEGYRTVPLRGGEPIHLPEEGEARVRVEWEGHVRSYVVGPVGDGIRAVRIEWPEGLEPMESRWRFASLTLGGEGAEPALLLLDGEGRPLAGQAVRVNRRNASAWGPSRADGTFPTTGAEGISPAGGGATMSTGARSAAFLLEVEGYLPMALVTGEERPLIVRYPPGALDLHVRAPSGEGLGFTAVVDGRVVEGGPEGLLLRGVPPGRHVVLLGARGHRPVQLTLTTGLGTRPIEATLEPR